MRLKCKNKYPCLHLSQQFTHLRCVRPYGNLNHFLFSFQFSSAASANEWVQIFACHFTTILENIAILYHSILSISLWNFVYVFLSSRFYFISIYFLCSFFLWSCVAPAPFSNHFVCSEWSARSLARSFVRSFVHSFIRSANLQRWKERSCVWCSDACATVLQRDWMLGCSAIMHIYW